ncbi:MAG TPA: GntR family transcriptional regulator [Gemmatimonadaceae bacterium]|nr:GntR family transcriptional regulator [Gemmatimonadaceae bacterium]
MQISIDIHDSVPVFAQLVNQIRDAVRRGELKPGAALPAIRQLALDLVINPNTVAKAYRLLERDNVIETRGRHGSFIHREGRKHSKVELSSQAVPVLAEAVAALRRAGLTDSEIRIAFASVMREDSMKKVPA